MGIIGVLKKIINVKNNDLSFLNVGDIVWARRYSNDLEKEKIKKGHQESPYVIIKKTKDEVYALQCTSNPHEEIKWKMAYYPLSKLNYDIKKNSFINCTKVFLLKEIQFVEIIARLSEYDLNQVKKQLYLIKNSNFKVRPLIENKYLDFKISVGDVILYEGDKYYINSIDDKYLDTYKLKKHIKVNDRVLIGNTYYSFVFNNIFKIKIKSKYSLVDAFNSGEVLIINNYKEKRTENKIIKSLRVGALINYKNKMFYVYEKNDESIKCFEVYSNIGSYDILINGGRYKTFFASVSILLEKLNQNGYSIRRCATTFEIEYNKNTFSLPKKKRNNYKNKILKGKDIDDYVPMVVLKDLNNGKYYLIIDRKDNIIELVNINDLGDTFYFELDKKYCTFEYYRVLSKEDFNMYLKKIKELKEICVMFNM